MLRWQGISADSAKAKARVAAAQANGQQVLVHLLQTPNWEGDGPSDAEIDQYVRRLRINIPKWAAMGVHHFEVWNEPDHKTFWGGTPNAARYTRMLKLAYPVIKAADPESVVISAGLTNHNDAYLAAMYRAGAKGYMDAVGTHMYSRYRPEDCDRRYKRRYLCNIADMRRVMVENGDTKKRIWMTEFGWWACPGASNCVSHGAQAAFVTRGYAFLERYPYLEGAFWFSDYDYAATSRLYGLRTRDLSRARASHASRPSPRTTPRAAVSEAVPPERGIGTGLESASRRRLPGSSRRVLPARVAGGHGLTAAGAWLRRVSVPASAALLAGIVLGQVAAQAALDLSFGVLASACVLATSRMVAVGLAAVGWLIFPPTYRALLVALRETSDRDARRAFRGPPPR